MIVMVYTYALFSPRSISLGPVALIACYPIMLAGLVLSCLLCFVDSNCAASKRYYPDLVGTIFFALAVGFVIVSGGYAVGGVSGAAFNPAGAIGLDVSILRDGVGWCFAWTAFELMGAMVAAILFRMVRPVVAMHLSRERFDASCHRH